MTWWSWRGARTRSHSELGRENPPRQWYCVLRRGRVGRRQVIYEQGKTSKNSLTSTMQNNHTHGAGWSSPVARQAHNLKVAGSNPAPATKSTTQYQRLTHIQREPFLIPECLFRTKNVRADQCSNSHASWVKDICWGREFYPDLHTHCRG